MKQEEIEKAAEKYAYNVIPDEHGMTFPIERDTLMKAFLLGINVANKYWQEKTRWKSLITEPPTEFGENKQILINHINGGACIYPLYSNASVEHAIDMGFIEWKEID